MAPMLWRRSYSTLITMSVSKTKLRSSLVSWNIFYSLSPSLYLSLPPSFSLYLSLSHTHTHTHTHTRTHSLSPLLSRLFNFLSLSPSPSSHSLFFSLSLFSSLSLSLTFFLSLSVSHHILLYHIWVTKLFSLFSPLLFLTHFCISSLSYLTYSFLY